MDPLFRLISRVSSPPRFTLGALEG